MSFIILAGHSNNVNFEMTASAFNQVSKLCRLQIKKVIGIAMKHHLRGMRLGFIRVTLKQFP